MKYLNIPHTCIFLCWEDLKKKLIVIRRPFENISLITRSHQSQRKSAINYFLSEIKYCDKRLKSYFGLSRKTEFPVPH